MLLDRIKTFLGSSDQAEEAGQNRILELASAALMIEVAKSDFQIEEEETLAIHGLLRRQFALSEEEVASIAALAGDQADSATCLFEFTRVINEEASPQKKRELIRMLWRVAMSDSQLSKYEEHLIRKIADLLYLTHSDFLLAKQEAHY